VLTDFPTVKFKVIYADPPWKFKPWCHISGTGKSAEHHYNTMTLEDICNLPVSSIAEEDSVLFLWVVQAQLPEAMEVIKAWDFKFQTVAFCWIKMPKLWTPFDGRVEPRIGLGYHTRSGMEQCWLATRGKGYQKHSKGVRQVLHSPLREHSRKPDEFVDRIEQLCGDVSRVELFGRMERPGWTVWGNDVKKFKQERGLF